MCSNCPRFPEKTGGTRGRINPNFPPGREGGGEEGKGKGMVAPTLPHINRDPEFMLPPPLASRWWNARWFAGREKRDHVFYIKFFMRWGGGGIGGGV